MIGHSWGGSGAGVVSEPLSDSLRQDLSLVARPAWQSAPAPNASGTPAPEADAPGAEASEPAPAGPAPRRAETPAAPAPGKDSGDATVAIEDSDPEESASSESKDVIVVADPPHRRHDGLLASTGAGGVLGLVAVALLGAGRC